MKITTHLCRPMDLGAHGNLFGGQLMYWLDEAAAIFAIRATGEPKIVTRRFSEALFEKPIRVLELVEFHCEDPKKGRTSLSFKVLAKVNGEIRFQGECTMVAIDASGHKKEIDWAHTPLAAEEALRKDL